MINCTELPSRQCYFEYPDGSINLVELSKADFDFRIIKELSKKEMAVLRRKLNLTPFSL
jgi:hypothetical protein